MKHIALQHVGRYPLSKYSRRQVLFLRATSCQSLIQCRFSTRFEASIKLRRCRRFSEQDHLRRMRYSCRLRPKEDSSLWRDQYRHSDQEREIVLDATVFLTFRYVVEAEGAREEFACQQSLSVHVHSHTLSHKTFLFQIQTPVETEQLVLV